MKYQKIPDTKIRWDKKNVFWIEDEDLVLFIKDLAKKIGENKYFGQYMPVNSINISSIITSYTPTQFVGKYLYIYQPKLANDKIKIQKQLKETIV